MMKRIIVVIILILAAAGARAQYADHHFDYAYKQQNQSQKYYDWKVFLVADAGFLSTVKQVEYYLDASFRNATRIVAANNSNPNFTLCANGWGSFDIRIRIIFKNGRADVNEVFLLNLSAPAKSDNNFQCGF